MNKGAALPKNLKPWALELVQLLRHEFRALVAGLSPQQRQEKGQMDRWSPKDELAHLAYWLEVFVANIRFRREGKPLTDVRDYLAMNDAAWEARQDWGLEQTEAAVRKVLTDLGEELERFTPEELTNPDRFTLEFPRPFVRSLLYELVDHPVHHFAGLYRKLGKGSEVGPMLRRLLEVLGRRGAAGWSATTRKKIQRHAP